MTEKIVILVIDDEPDIHSAIQAILKREPYELIFAQNGKEGLELVRKRSPQFILLDLRMPVMDGITFLEHLKPTPSDPYFVFVLTAHGDNEDVDACYERGAQGFLRKPFNVTELRGLIRQNIKLLRNVQLSNQNKDAYIDFMVGSSTYHTNQAVIQFFFKTIQHFQFETWAPLEVSILLREEGKAIGQSDQNLETNDLDPFDQQILEQALNEFFVETESNESDPSAVHAAWAILWDLEEDISKANGFAILVRNYPTLNVADEADRSSRRKLREEIENIVAKLLERVAELVQKLSNRRKLEETNVLLQQQKEALEHERENTKKILSFTVREFQRIFDENAVNEEKQMEIWEGSLDSLGQSLASAMALISGTPSEQQKELWEKALESLNNSFTSAMELFNKTQPNQQTFLNNLTKLKEIYGESKVNEKLAPGQMSETEKDQQQGVDDLLASLGL